jgi:hypothetical protein
VHVTQGGGHAFVRESAQQAGRSAASRRHAQRLDEKHFDQPFEHQLAT